MSPISGTRWKCLGGTHMIAQSPQIINGTQDGFLFVSHRTVGVEAEDEKRICYEVCYTITCLERPLPWETTCLEGLLVFGRRPKFISMYWVIEPVSSGHNFMASGVCDLSRQVSLYPKDCVCRDSFHIKRGLQSYIYTSYICFKFILTVKYEWLHVVV